MTGSAASNTAINKPEIAARIATRKMVAIDQSVIHQSMDIILEHMIVNLVAGKRVELRGFGSFSINEYAPRKARNPKSGEVLAIQERRRPHFKPSSLLRKNVDKSAK